ncbi:MAG TPA: alpha-1,4-glucan--maltose-1-phosphate maltosyltransferase [Gaiellaceae bacterium]
MPPPEKKPPRIVIQDVWPQVDCGRWPPKRTVGDRVDVWADVFRDGHDVLRAVVRYRRPGARRYGEAPMEHVSADRWTGSFVVDEAGLWCFSVEAWTDRFASWRHELERKAEAGQADLTGELSEGAALLEDLVAGLKGTAQKTAQAALEAVAAESPQRDRVKAALAPELAVALATGSERPDAVALPRPLDLDVDRERARFGAWYELFPRSWGGFAGLEKRLPEFAELGADVLYFPPIHPIGTTHRKGKNNAEIARPGEPGSPWAIGSEAGGHTAVHPDLGTLADFDRLVESARAHGIEIALDFAIQCSPDHPWLREHPEWFHHRPDGTLKYAENPPKRYQDIYNVNFDSEDREGLWNALRDVMLFWVDRGVRVFRVDNPHTKPVPFWEWLIAEVRAREPEVVLLSEAFTRPAMMTTLGKAGFQQSYTYFTWKNTKSELVELMGQLLEWSLFLRPNFFANTPDILHEYLQRGGRPAFEARLVLAATLSPSYGIYSGFESCENVPAAAGSEEYLDSEKYEAKQRALDGELLPLVQKLNAIRREHPALQRLENLRWLETENEQLVAYAKDDVLVVVNLDPRHPQEGVTVIPAALGLPPAFTVRDLLAGENHAWRIGRNYVRLDPGQSHVLHVRR